MKEPSKTRTFLENAEGLTIWRYLLEKLSNGVGLSDEVYIMIINNLEAMLKWLPDLAEKYVEMVLLNPDIWAKTTKESQERVMLMARGLAEEYKGKLRIDHFVDMLMHCIETLAESDRDDKSAMISQLSELVVLWAKQSLTESVLSKITSYANIYYIRRLSAYPMQLYYVLSILLNLFTNCIDGEYLQDRQGANAAGDKRGY